MPFIFSASSSTELATTISLHSAASFFTSLGFPKSIFLKNVINFLSLIASLNSAPETASSFLAIFQFRIIHEYFWDCLQISETRNRVSVPVTKGVGWNLLPSNVVQSADFGGTRLKPCKCLSGVG